MITYESMARYHREIARQAGMSAIDCLAAMKRARLPYRKDALAANAVAWAKLGARLANMSLKYERLSAKGATP